MTTNGHSYANSGVQVDETFIESADEEESKNEEKREADKLLILEIKDWPVVFDKKSKMKEDITESQAWDIIGAKFKKSAETCKTRFKRLREQYSRERKKREQGSKGTFQDYDLMSYIDPFIKKRPKGDSRNRKKMKTDSNLQTSNCNEENQVTFPPNFSQDEQVETFTVENTQDYTLNEFSDENNENSNSGFEQNLNDSSLTEPEVNNSSRKRPSSNLCMSSINDEIMSMTTAKNTSTEVRRLNTFSNRIPLNDTTNKPAPTQSSESYTPTLGEDHQVQITAAPIQATESSINGSESVKNSIEIENFRQTNKKAAEYVVSRLKEMPDSEEKDDLISNILVELLKKKKKRN